MSQSCSCSRQPPTPHPHPLLPTRPTRLAFPHAALREGRVLPPTLGSRHPPPRTPPQGQPRPLPRIFHVAMQTRGCQALQTILPCESSGAWALLWPAAPRLPAGGGACPQGSGGRCWACGSRYCSPHPLTSHRGPRIWKVPSHVDLAVLGPPVSPPKLAGPRAMVQSVPNSDPSTTDSERVGSRGAGDFRRPEWRLRARVSRPFPSNRRQPLTMGSPSWIRNRD